MRKGIIWLLLIAMLLAVMTGCSRQGQTEEPDIATEEPVHTVVPEPPAKETGTEEETGQTAPPSQSSGTAYTDNFSVSNADVTAYAQMVQQVVKEKDLDAFTEMVAFPIYIMGADGGQSITSASDFKALGEEQIFSDAFVTEITSANTDGLNPSRAGFVLSATGRPNLVFGVVNGELHIVSLNY